MPMSAPDFEQLLADGTRHELGGQAVTVRLRQDVSLALPSGRVVAGEPTMFGIGDNDRSFVQKVAPGRYPLVLAVAEFEGPDGTVVDERNAAARLVIRDEPVVSWEMAVTEGRDPAVLDDDQFYGYPVDGGTGGFVDPVSLPDLGWDKENYVDRLTECMGHGNDYPAPGTLDGADGTPLLVVFASGWGDGHYPTWVGRTAIGEIGCFLTDFFVLTDEDDEEPGEPLQPTGLISSTAPQRVASTPFVPRLGSIASPMEGFGISAVLPATQMVEAASGVASMPANERD